MINIGVRVKNQIIRVFIKMIIREILARVIANITRCVKLADIQILKMCHAKNSA